MSAQKLNQFELNLFAEVDAFCVEVGINQEAYIKEKGLRDLVGKMKRHQEAKKQFHCDGCGCDVVRDSREHDECLSDKNGENWVCGDCYQGEYDKECAHCGDFCPDEYEGDIDGDEEPLCEDCFEQMEKCEMCGDPTDAEEWSDIQEDVLYCSPCKDKYKERIAECEAIVKSSSSREEALVKWENLKLERAVAKAEAIDKKVEAIREAEPEPDEEFEADVINSHLLEVFGGEVVYNKVKELAKYPDLSSTLRVVWKFGKEHLSLYVYIEGEPFLDAVYPRNHSCDMFYMLEELKKEQEE